MNLPRVEQPSRSLPRPVFSSRTARGGAGVSYLNFQLSNLKGLSGSCFIGGPRGKTHSSSRGLPDLWYPTLQADPLGTEDKGEYFFFALPPALRDQKLVLEKGEFLLGRTFFRGEKKTKG